MTIQFEKHDNIFVIHISEMLRRTELDEIKTRLLARVKGNDEIVNILAVIGDNFISLGGIIDWDDDNADDEYLQKRVHKLAVMGDIKWKERAFEFMSGGTIPINIKFFTLEDKELANAWLNEIEPK